MTHVDSNFPTTGRTTMKTTQLAVLIAAGAMFGAAVPALAENAMYSCTRADGTVSLTNVPVGTKCEQLFAYKPPVDAAPAPVAGQSPAPAAPAVAPAAPQARPAMASTEQKARPPADANAPAAAGAHSSLAMRMSQRRDAARLAVADAYARGEPASVPNPATSRRYLMTNRADYIQANGFTPQ